MSPEEGTQSWCEEGPALVRTECEGSGAPLSIDKGNENFDNSDQFKLRCRERPRKAAKKEIILVLHRDCLIYLIILRFFVLLLNHLMNRLHIYFFQYEVVYSVRF